jgi:hypothetical protein
MIRIQSMGDQRILYFVSAHKVCAQFNCRQNNPNSFQFIVPLSTAVLPYTTPASAGATHDNCGVQGHDVKTKLFGKNSTP